MPPKKGIVKSGNAGNSSKASKPPEVNEADASKPPPLFPPGSKYPLSLLQERCQHNGWDKPSVETRRQPGAGGYSFSITLARHNSKTFARDTVRMEPYPPYVCPSVLEARHWGATYALYRFCNSLQLNRVLPPGPREYWNELAVEHKGVPDHMKWMYNSDPFAARQEVEARQAKSAKKKEDIAAIADKPRAVNVSPEYAQAPEVRMASALRELVEDAVKKAIELYPESADADAGVISAEDLPDIVQQLGHLEFTPKQAQNAVAFLSTPSPLSSYLLASSSALEASIEYLILHVPECDLPQRFLPSENSSNPFITAGHSGAEDLKKRWIEDRAIKEAGWPAYAVRQCTTDPRLQDSWKLLITALGQRLIGEDWESLHEAGVAKFTIDSDEVQALGAHYESENHIIMPLFSAPIQVHLLVSPDNLYPVTGHPSIYLASKEVAAYVRLHLLSTVLQSLRAEDFTEPGEGFLMAVMRHIEGEWASIEDNGPPDMMLVLKHILPKVARSAGIDDTMPTPNGPNPKGKRRGGYSRRATSTNEEVKQQFEALQKTDKYRELFASRSKLPAFASRNDFLETLEKSRVVIVVGETGCGKTTQLPQFILDELILSGRGGQASIVVTQPRRISAISVATRVSAERLDDGSVGYAIRGESKQDKRTKLLFCTTGVVLRRLGTGDSLQDVDYVIVDEVHERSLDGDFLLLELKELLKRHKTLKVVLMSATINHETFVRYFDGAPLITIPGFTYPVTDMYLEDIVPLTKYRPQAARHGNNTKEKGDTIKATEDAYREKGLDVQTISAIQTISRSDRIDYQLIASVVSHIVTTGEKRGGILIFLSGVQEIRQCLDAVRQSLSSDVAEILPLHANLSNDEQRRVFLKTSKWKVIAATNVAETSITIDDVIYVIDAGKVKETQYDPESHLSRLVETWVTRAAARQRRGRAGRTQPGFCYKLYTRKQEENMAKFPVPEILRVPLESISLTVKVMREDEDVKLFLSRAIDPPKIVAMEQAWAVLEELGAVDLEGKLTALGRHISMLPLDLRLSKMLVLGAIFQCLGPVLTIAACLSSKPLFLSPLDKRDEAAQARARFETGDSDLLTDLHAYDEVMQLRADGKPQGFIKSFCEEHFISPTTVREITTLRQEFIGSLSELGFIPLGATPATPALNTNSTKVNLLKAVILGGLWPQVARVHLPPKAIKFDKVQAGTVQRANTAKEYKLFDLGGARVFLHPGSVLFAHAAWRTPLVVYFQKHMTSKVFLRDATQAPLYALLLFGGPVAVNHVAGGLTVGTRTGAVKLRAWPRIGVLVNQLRRLLDVQLQRCVEGGTMLSAQQGSPVLNAMLALLEHDGLTGLG